MDSVDKYLPIELREEVEIKKIIQDLIETNWSKDNKSQMKAIQLLKGIALSNDPLANSFMEKLDNFTTNITIEEL